MLFMRLSERPGCGIVEENGFYSGGEKQQLYQTLAFPKVSLFYACSPAQLFTMLEIITRTFEESSKILKSSASSSFLPYHK
jgi:hypothetical protein